VVISSIDIGTNTILMATLDFAEDGSVRVLSDEHGIARLGKGVDASRRILPETFDRVAGYLDRYREIARSLGATTVVAFGTSALRDAVNRQEFIDAMTERTGIPLRVLEGNEEAVLTFRGALFGLVPFDGECAVLDIGGGSTELALGQPDGVVTQEASLDIGAVRITERFLLSAPPSAQSLHDARRWADKVVSGFFPIPSRARLIGVAGTVTTLGALSARLEQFDADVLNGYRLTAGTVAEWLDRLSTMSHDAIRALHAVHPDRADILLGGVVILDATMRRLGFQEITVSTRGLRYGMAARIHSEK